MTFYGGAGEVGRNCFLLEDGKDRLLLDAGVKLGEKEEYPNIPDAVLKGLGAISISHAHLDHIGYLPFMFRKGCNARIYATKPTRDVMQLLLSDFLNIRQKREMRRRFAAGGERQAGGRLARDGGTPQYHAHQQKMHGQRPQYRAQHATHRFGSTPQARHPGEQAARGPIGARPHHPQRPERHRPHVPHKIGDVGFSEHDIVKVLRHTEMMEYGAEKRVGSGLWMTFNNAGHILGSATVLLRGARRLLYTADLNLRETMLLDPAKKGVAADVLITESTYGGKNDVIEPVKAARAEFIRTIDQTVKKGGKVLVPSFAVGRGQEVLFILESYMRSGMLEKVPIFVDGMILKANRIYRQNAIYCKDEVQKRILMSEEDPFKSPLFREPSKTRNEVYKEGPAIIVTTSGMMTGGPALDYFKRLAGDARNKLVLVGYQAQGTLGRRLLEGEKEVGFAEELIRVRMDVENVSFSAHADHAQLVEFARSVKGLKKVFIIHGEGSKPKELAEDLERDYEVVIPKNGEAFNF